MHELSKRKGILKVESLETRLSKVAVRSLSPEKE